MKTKMIAIVVALVVIAGGIFFFLKQNSQPVPSAEAPTDPAAMTPPEEIGVQENESMPPPAQNQ